MSEQTKEVKIMEKVSFASYSLRDYIKSLGLDVDDFLEYINDLVTWGDESVKYILLDPLHVGWWIADFLVVCKISCDFSTQAYEEFLKKEEVVYFFL